MAQVKKAHIRGAILQSADRLFKRQGYISTTTAQIAKGAKISESNLYVYFDSKFEVLFALYEPWLRERIYRLEGRVEQEKDARRQLRLILTTLWLELPADDKGFTNNLMQALTMHPDSYSSYLLRWTESRVQTMILSALPENRRREFANRGLAHLLMMTQDGLAMNFHLNGRNSETGDLIELACNLILGTPREFRDGNKNQKPSEAPY